jgi:hypothetical protein
MIVNNELKSILTEAEMAQSKGLHSFGLEENHEEIAAALVFLTTLFLSENI